MCKTYTIRPLDFRTTCIRLCSGLYYCFLISFSRHPYLYSLALSHPSPPHRDLPIRLNLYNGRGHVKNKKQKKPQTKRVYRKYSTWCETYRKGSRGVGGTGHMRRDAHDEPGLVRFGAAPRTQDSESLLPTARVARDECIVGVGHDRKWIDAVCFFETDDSVRGWIQVGNVSLLCLINCLYIYIT